MHLVPKKFFISSGCAVSKVSDLNAFDKALLEAGIGELNIVSVSSVLPVGAEQVGEQVRGARSWVTLFPAWHPALLACEV